MRPAVHASTQLSVFRYSRAIHPTNTTVIKPIGLWTQTTPEITRGKYAQFPVAKSDPLQVTLVFHVGYPGGYFRLLLTLQ